MYILDLIPITNIPKEHSQIYSYFSDEFVENGALVLISFNNRSLKGLVLNCESIKYRKLDIKKSDFGLKKITGVFYRVSVILPWQIDLVFWMSQYYFASPTSILKVVLPNYLIKRKTKIKIDLSPRLQPEADPPLEEMSPGLKATPRVVTRRVINQDKLFEVQPQTVWGNREERFAAYLSKIKKLKKGEQVLFLVPEFSLIQQAADFLRSKGESSCVVLSGELTEKKYFENWMRAKNGKAKVIIGIRGAVFTQFKNLKLIILDQPSSDSYKSWDKSPKYSAGEIALKIAEFTGAKVVFGDFLPGVEIFHSLTKSDLPTGQAGFIGLNVIDMQNEWKKGNFILSEELMTELNAIVQKRQKAVLFVNRKGFATNIFCQECDFVFECPHCQRPLVYYENRTQDNLECGKCGFKQQESLVCHNCGGRKIRYSGIAVQKVEKEIKENISHLKVFRFDADLIKTKKEQSEVLKRFLKEKSTVLIATGFIFNKLLSKVDFAAVVSVDSILNIPDFRSAEKALKILAQTAEMQKSQKLLVQTNLAEHPLFQYLKSGDLTKFFSDELEARKMMNYPPFSQLVLFESFRLRGERFMQNIIEKIKKEAEELGINVDVLNPFAGKLIFKFILPLEVEKRDAKRYFLNDKYLEKRNQILNILLPFAGKRWKIDVDPISLF